MTYAGLATVVLMGAGLTAVLTARVLRLPRRWWWATAVVGLALLVLTAVFDSAMIAADLFRYDAASLTGVRVLLMPVEDFAWPIAAVLVLPSLWELFGRLTRAGGRHREH